LSRNRTPRRRDPEPPAEWSGRLRAPILKQTQLTSIVVEALTARVPECLVEASGALEATISTPRDAVLTAYLGSLWNTLSSTDPEERLEELEPFLKSLVDSARSLGTGSRTPGRERVVPLIKDDRFFSEIDPAFAPASERLVADLSIVYAFDHPHALEIMTEAERVTLGVPAADMRELSVRNLRRLVPEVGYHGDGTRYMLLAGGNFEASLLLLDEIWTRLAAEVTGDLIACVPARDLMLYTGTGVAGGIESLRRVATRVLTQGAYAISGTLLRWTGDGWETYTAATLFN
jgi:hypothetical protein